MARIKGFVNASGLKKFKANLEKLNESQRREWNESALKELAARLLKRVIHRTPIGKAPVDLKKMKQTQKVVGASGKSRTFLTAEAAELQKRFGMWEGYKGGTLRKSWTAGAVVKTGGAYTIEIINPEKYAPYVEFGHRQTPGRYVPAIGKRLKRSWVNGKFMLTVSEQELQADAPGILAKKLEKFMKGAFK